jgi:hypothetical protein
MLKDLEIETRLGKLYKFPDVAEGVRLPVGSGLDENTTQLTVTNVSGACLVIPFRIIAKLWFNGSLVWEGPNL